jgi:hypothetical protein
MSSTKQPASKSGLDSNTIPEPLGGGCEGQTEDNEEEKMFDYLINKIIDADFSHQPFKHIYIDNFFSEEHFIKIISSREIKLSKSNSDDELFNNLFKNNYKIISFPGSITDHKKYIDWHSKRKTNIICHTACESAGMVLRLFSEDEFLRKLSHFIGGNEFNTAIAHKFGINLDECDIDGGIQKYLDGYEISPHPDIRKKAATFMVNINPHDDSESFNHHTQYLKFKKSKEYIRHFWDGNPDCDRTWVPWDWCEKVFEQKKNNSIVIFSPSNETMHAVKANYDHLKTQRTQLYGNIWHKEDLTKSFPSWEKFNNFHLSAYQSPKESYKSRLYKYLPNRLTNYFRRLTSGDNYYKRSYK